MDVSTLSFNSSGHLDTLLLQHSDALAALAKQHGEILAFSEDPSKVPFLPSKVRTFGSLLQATATSFQHLRTGFARHTALGHQGDSSILENRSFESALASLPSHRPSEAATVSVDDRCASASFYNLSLLV